MACTPCSCDREEQRGPLLRRESRLEFSVYKIGDEVAPLVQHYADYISVLSGQLIDRVAHHLPARLTGIDD